MQRTGLMAFTCCCAVLLLGACGQQVEGKAERPEDGTNGEATEKEAAIAIPVEAALPGRSDISAYFETTARIEAETRVEVIPKGAGHCLEVRSDVGKEVKAGETLATLDTDELEAQIRQTRVNVSQQKTSLELAERLLAEGIGAPVERDNARFAFEQAQATLESQELQLRNQTLVSPIDGLVTERGIQPGMLVGSGMRAFTIVDPSSYVLPINLPERELTRLNAGQEAYVSIDSRPGEAYLARIRRINPSVDPVSGTIRVLLDFDDDARPYLREGAFARVKLVMETHVDALVVPKDAILEDNTRTYLMAVREETKEEGEVAPDSAVPAAFRVEKLEVTTGLEDSNSIEIVSGISEDELVVTLGQHTLKQGSLVKVTNARDEILSRANMTAEEALAAAKDRQSGGGRSNDRETRRRNFSN